MVDRYGFVNQLKKVETEEKSELLGMGKSKAVQTERSQRAILKSIFLYSFAASSLL